MVPAQNPLVLVGRPMDPLEHALVLIGPLGISSTGAPKMGEPTSRLARPLNGPGVKPIGTARTSNGPNGTAIGPNRQAIYDPQTCPQVTYNDDSDNLTQIAIL